jgi:serine palmitoyltransferase
MALSSLSPRSSFTGSIKRTSSDSKSRTSRDAASLLAAVRQADALARERTPSPSSYIPTNTPALSMSSSVSDSSTIQELYDNDSDGLKPRVYGNDEHDEPFLLHPSSAPTSEQAPQDTRHTEFGHCWNENYRHVSSHPPGEPLEHLKEMEPPYYILLSTYMSYMLLIMIGHIRDFVGKRGKRANYKHLMPYNVSLGLHIAYHI